MNRAGGIGVIAGLSLLIAAGIFSRGGGGIGPACNGTNINVNSNVPSIVAAAPAGTMFCIYGQQNLGAAVVAKAGDVFIGKVGAVFDGGATGCPSACSGGTALAIDGNNVNNVTVKNITFQNFSGTSQVPIVGKNNVGSGWDIENNTVLNSKTEGIRVGASATVKNNTIHDLGQLGISGFQSTGALVQNNTIYNICLTSCNATYYSNGGGEAGGIKMFEGNGMTISGNIIHDTGGVGLWLDTDVYNTTVTGNTLTNNGIAGVNNTQQLQVEISCNDTISNNTISDGTGTNIQTSNLPGAGISLATSHDNIVTGNTVTTKEVAIGMWDDSSRSTQSHCGAPVTTNNTVDNNTMTLSTGGASAITGFNEFICPVGGNNVQPGSSNCDTNRASGDTWGATTANVYHIPKDNNNCASGRFTWYANNSGIGTGQLNYTFAQWTGTPLGTNKVAQESLGGSTCAN